MTVTEPIPQKPLAGWRVLVPRGGTWGDSVAARLRSQGAVPVVAPLIDIAATTDVEQLNAALAALSGGAYDWLTVTSTTTVDVLFGTKIPATTKIAAVGATSAAALEAAGFTVALVADHDNSAERLAEQIIGLESEPRRILRLRSEISKPILTQLLLDAGHDVHSVIAYRTVGVPASSRVLRDVADGRINAILITSGSVAAQVREQFDTIPQTTLVAALGPLAAQDAITAGLRLPPVADRDTVEELIRAVSQFTLPHAADEFAP